MALQNSTLAYYQWTKAWYYLFVASFSSLLNFYFLQYRFTITENTRIANCIYQW